MQQFTPAKTVIFAAIVCFVCGIFVATAAVGLKPLQEKNAILDRQKNILSVAGLLTDEVAADPAKLEQTYAERINPTAVAMTEGGCADENKGGSFSAPAGNKAKVASIPNCAEVFLVRDASDKSKTETIILPVEGKGLWSTLKGYLAMNTNGVDIKGLTFYSHAETPGLGGEVDNPKWKKQWTTKKAFKAGVAQPAIQVVKGQAKDEYGVDGLSGATLTSNGVTFLVQFWLSQERFGAYLKNFKG
jgi:Na+-transporting NADH:ubiquinone oxidoreductase subunit C